MVIHRVLVSKAKAKIAALREKPLVSEKVGKGVLRRCIVRE